MTRLIFATFFISIFLNQFTIAAPRCENIFKIHDLSSYEMTESKPIGLQIFERDLLAAISLIDRIQLLPKESFVQEVMKRDLRKHFFRLQAMASIYAEKSKHEKFFTDLKIFTKEFEDLLGQIDLQKSLRERAEKFQYPDLVSYFTNKQTAAEDKMYQRLSEEKLLTKPKKTLKQIYAEIADVQSWQDVTKDRKFLAKVIAEKAEKLQKACGELKFDNPDIELGLHELRRHLRWSVIQLALLDGAIVNTPETQLPEKLNQWMSEMQAAQPQLLTSKFIQRMSPQLENPMQAPLKMTAMISQIVTDIGTSKDIAEMQLYFSEAAKEIGWTDSQIDSMKNKTGDGQVVNHQDLAKRYQQRISDTGLMHEFAEWIKKNN